MTVRIGQASCNVWRDANLEPFTGFTGGLLLVSAIAVSVLNLCPPTAKVDCKSPREFFPRHLLF